MMTDATRHTALLRRSIRGAAAILMSLGLIIGTAAAQQEDAPLEGMERDQPSDTDRTSPQPRTDKLKPASPDGDVPSGFRRHALTDHGFAVAFPAHWTPVGIRGAVKINYRGGLTSCNVNVIAGKFPGKNGRPSLLAIYLAALNRQNIASKIPARMQPRVIEVANNNLGGQPAKKIVMDIVASGRQMRMVQYLTFRTNGIYTLTCGAPRNDFGSASNQTVFDQVKGSFGFL